MEELLKKVEAQNLISSGDRICVAVSGGVDSVVLLRVLHALGTRLNLKLTIAHLNHKLRGRASDHDERFVSKLSEKLDLPIVTRRVEVRALAQENKISLEMAAREARHKFLAEVASQEKAKLALAHHASDQVELFFLRLLRGSSTTGLAGMKPCSKSPVDPKVVIVRPLLACTKTEILEAAKEFEYRTDKSNEDIAILRNAVRKILIPLLKEKFQPNIEPVILRTMEILKAEDELLESINGNHIALHRRKILKELQRLQLKGDFQAVETLRTSEKPVSIAGKVVVCKGQKVLPVDSAAFSTSEIQIVLQGNSGSGAFAGGEFSWQFGSGPGERFDADSVGEVIRLRHWKPGDRFHPIGMKSPSKLQNIFTNLKVPAVERRKRVLAENSKGEIFWVEGLRISHCCRVTPETKKVLVWSWKKSR